MKTQFLALSFVALATNALSQGSSVYNLRSDTIDVLHYNVHLDIKDFTTHVIGGYTEVTLSPKMPTVNRVCFDLLKMSIDSVIYNNDPITTFYNDTLLVCHFPAPVNDNDTVAVRIYYHGVPQEDPTWGGFYFSGSYAYNLGVAFTSVPHNFGRTWHPCFDNFVERATYEMHITTTGGKVAYCNGIMESETVSGADITRKWVMNDPIPTYLACVSVNAYTHVTQDYISTVTGNHIPINLISLPADTTKFKNSFINLPVAIQAYEEHFHPYEWDKVGFVAVPFSAGAMEHATIISYPLATLTGTTAYQNLMAHELSHHWWGDLVTCETAEDMWINEGFARWCEALFFEQLNGYSAYLGNIRDMHKKVVWKAHIDDGGFYPISGVPQSVTYGTTTYEKGADMVHTLRGYLGDSLFFAGLKHIQNNFKFKNINAIQFRDELNTFLSPAGVNVTDYFNDWVLQPGFVQFAVDSMKVSGSGTYSSQVFYKQKLRGATHLANNVPMQVTFIDNDFNRYSTRVMLGGASGNFTVTGIPFEPVVVFLNGDEKISQAVTAQEQYLTVVGSKIFSNANLNMQVQSISDSVWARVEHHWVAADPFIYSNFLYTISPDRFWSVYFTGDVPNFQAKATLNYNGTTSASGHLDNGLMAALSTGFNEDSLRLFYRPNAGENWEVLSGVTFTVGSKTDKVGSLSIDNLKAGDYALGIKTSAVGIAEVGPKQSKLKIYPNPTNGLVTVEVKGFDVSGHDTVVIIDQAGNQVSAMAIRSSKTEINVSGLASAPYFVALLSKGKVVETQKLLVK